MFEQSKSWAVTCCCSVGFATRTAAQARGMLEILQIAVWACVQCRLGCAPRGRHRGRAAAGRAAWRRGPGGARISPASSRPAGPRQHLSPLNLEAHRQVLYDPALAPRAAATTPAQRVSPATLLGVASSTVLHVMNLHTISERTGRKRTECSGYRQKHQTNREYTTLAAMRKPIHSIVKRSLSFSSDG